MLIFLKSDYEGFDIMFSFQVYNLNKEYSCIYNCENLSLLYVTDGEIQVFYHSLNKYSYVKKGFYSIVPFDEYSYINALNGDVKIITLNYLLIYTIANNLYNNLISKDYTNLPFSKNEYITQYHLNFLAKYSPFKDSSLSTEISYSINTLLYLLQENIRKAFDIYSSQTIHQQPYSLNYTNIKRRRLFDASVELLNNPQKSIAHIATEFGFYDQAHFTKVFKKYRNITPHAFRQRHAFFKHYK